MLLELAKGAIWAKALAHPACPKARALMQARADAGAFIMRLNGQGQSIAQIKAALQKAHPAQAAYFGA